VQGAWAPAMAIGISPPVGAPPARIFENGHSQGQSPGMTPENAELLAGFAGHLQRSKLTGHSRCTCLGQAVYNDAWHQRT
jgi:hypothetical protein